MELTVYDIIKGKVISDKAYKLNQKNQQLVLEVHPKANKPLIRDALKKLFNVEIETVRTVNRKKSNARTASRRYNANPSTKIRKIAYVTLAEGHSLNLFEQTEVAAARPEQGQAA
jgi:large subunit ribosomal protein L23